MEIDHRTLEEKEDSGRKGKRDGIWKMTMATSQMQRIILIVSKKV